MDTLLHVFAIVTLLDLLKILYEVVGNRRLGFAPFFPNSQYSGTPLNLLIETFLNHFILASIQHVISQ